MADEKDTTTNEETTQDQAVEQAADDASATTVEAGGDADPATQEAADVSDVDAAGLLEESEDERADLTVKVEDTGPARKKLNISVPGEFIQKKIEGSFDDLSDEAIVPGFRKGRAPKRLLEKRFGSAVRDDVKGQIISSTYSQAIEDEKLDVLGEPEIKDIDQIELPEDGPLEYEVEVEVVPSFELPNLEGIEVTRPVKGIADEDVDAELEKVRERFGKMAAVEDAEVTPHDYAKVDVRILEGEDARDDATEIAHHPGAYILVHGEDKDYKGHVAGILVPDMGKQLAGKKAGDVVRISMTGPSGHEDNRIKDQPITLVIRIDEVHRLEPASVESLVEQLGVENEDELKGRLREMLSEQREREAQNMMREQVNEYLSNNVEMNLPEGLSGRQIERALQRTKMNLAMQGVPVEEIEERAAEMRSEAEEEAIKQLKLFFVVSKAAEELEVQVDEAEINREVFAMARQRGRRPEKLRQELARAGQLEQLFLQIREQKTLDKIIESANVTESEDAGKETDDADDKAKASKKKSKKKSSKKSAKKAEDKSDDKSSE